MKNLLMTVSAVAIMAAAAFPAHAECDGWYAALRGGLVQHDVSGSGSGSSLLDSDSVGLDDNRLMLSGAVGYRYENYRAELEYVWRKSTHDTDKNHLGIESESKFKTYSYMLNVYYDVLPYNWWTPYVGAGIGLTQLKFSNVDKNSGYVNTRNGNYKPLNFTWSVGAGLSLKVTNRFNVDAGYRYYDMGGLRQADVDAQEFYAGVRYVF